MNQHWCPRLALCIGVFETKARRELEVELHCCALMLPPQRIPHRDVDFWAIKCTIPRVHLPRPTCLIQCLAQRTFRFLPRSVVSQRLLRARGAAHAVLESKLPVNALNKLEAARHLAPHLVLIVGTEDVTIVLCEASDSGEAVQRARRLIAMQRREVSEAHWHLTMRARRGVEDEAVSGAAHRLQTHPCTTIFVAVVVVVIIVTRAANNGIHILFIVVPMP